MTEFTTSLTKITHQALIDLVRYWQQLDPAPTVPNRQQFNPIDIPHCLRHIILFDVGVGRPRYFIRLAGSSVNPVYQKPVTGEYLENVLSEEDRPAIIAQYDYSVTYQRPTYMAGTVSVPSGRKLNYERVVLPLTTNGDMTDKLLVGINFSDVKQHLIDRPAFKL
ncbi:PAS domain-containing protein [Sneathiella sp.]|uniref:PAS domain-containing protein n=1 Tax=Sneathiella sp. TaxID=1964365 RepID=UPI0026264202|nr:PAS domain-containing protein [Sneathiella sp.]MDF2368392.1 PAS domain-containing protein [Sneathiella sp.]